MYVSPSLYVSFIQYHLLLFSRRLAKASRCLFVAILRHSFSRLPNLSQNVFLHPFWLLNICLNMFRNSTLLQIFNFFEWGLNIHQSRLQSTLCPCVTTGLNIYISLIHKVGLKCVWLGVVHPDP